jgi:Domain of unknown function (DUF4157)
MLNDACKQLSLSREIHAPALADVLGAAGDRLDTATLRFMEDGYSADFRDVIIHTSEQSHRANAALGTTAFTTAITSVSRVALTIPTLGPAVSCSRTSWHTSCSRAWG